MWVPQRAPIFGTWRQSSSSPRIAHISGLVDLPCCLDRSPYIQVYPHLYGYRLIQIRNIYQSITSRTKFRAVPRICTQDDPAALDENPNRISRPAAFGQVGAKMSL